MDSKARYRKRVVRTCNHCGKTFAARIDRDNKFCSHSCYSADKQIHGLSVEKPPIYKAWLSMRERCLQVSCSNYKHYGGRGITIDSAWNDFCVFYTDMSPTWQPGLSLNRKDNNGPYSKDNCEWATVVEQNNNKTNTIIVDTPVGRLPLALAAKHYGKCYTTVFNRYNNGYRGCYLFL